MIRFEIAPNPIGFLDHPKEVSASVVTETLHPCGVHFACRRRHSSMRQRLWPDPDGFPIALEFGISLAVASLRLRNILGSEGHLDHCASSDGHRLFIDVKNDSRPFDTGDTILWGLRRK
ncbi:hypothetical protein IPV08_04425 [Methylobacterium sp. SD274]|uniref:hypothetical protein n=1 Tax=Methylobacterium sp. SD274 TaxID=2782009 RepID=UPI001A95A28F|nr:hypothetical protein [Methylobacterium sp. SD274]MBO1019214.1 hypothetical protein [Methylobacterium sp. SD274]